MDLFLAKSFIASFLLVLCVKYLHTEEMKNPLRRKVTEQKPKERNHIAHRENEDICRCDGNICYYCENGLFCNNQRKACCPDNKSKSDCGGFCVPPEYKCCYDKKGACHQDNPVCCDERCCVANSHCCGKGCCRKKEKCCKNTRKNEYFCIKETVEPAGYCENADCVKDVFNITNDIFEYFAKMCETFKDKTRQTNPKNIIQFAVLTINNASDSNENHNKYDPTPLVFELDKQLGNYASASSTPKEHAERRILQNFNERINNFRELKPDSKPVPPNIYLLTFLSPCDSCVEDIVQTMKSVKDVEAGTKYIGWHFTYNRMTQAKFLKGIETLMKEKIAIVTKINGICPNEKEPPLFQPTLLEELQKRYKNENIGNCGSHMALQSSFIKLINWLVWDCKDYFKINDEKAKDDVINCMNESIGKLEPKVNPCIDLPVSVRDAISNIHKNNKNMLLSPPLDPNSETVSISNDIDDLHANYEKPYFCFQVLYESVEN